MSRRARLIGCGLVAFTALLMLAGLVFWFLGSAMVFDRHGQIVAAAIVTTDGRRQELHRLPGGTFYAAPDLEGTIELTCRDGFRPTWGYVTGHMHTWLTIEPGPGCGRIVES